MKRLLILLLVAISSPAFAVDYYWSTIVGGNEFKDSTPSGVCSKVQADLSDGFASYRFTGKVSDTLAYCQKYRLSDGANLGSLSINRFGDGCTSPAVYNSTTGGCEVPEAARCAALAGASKAFSKSGNAPDGYMKVLQIGGKSTAVQSTEGCFSGCMASTSDQKCTTKVSGAYLCKGTAYYSGQTCDAAGAPGVDDSSTSEYPQTSETNETKPCNYTTNADGTQSCTSEKNSEKEGQVCGVVSATGAKICVDKQPSKNGLSIATTVKTDSATGDKTKTDTATTTTCNAIKTCTSTSTTVTTVIKSNGSVSSTCQGANCPDKNTNPDGDGDGFGDCATGDCGEGGDGDGGPSKPGLDDVDDYQTTTQKFYNSVNNSPVVKAVDSISAPITGTAPNMRTGSLSAIGGASLDFSIMTQLKPIIDDVLSGVMKAFWCFVAVMIFLAA